MRKSLIFAASFLLVVLVVSAVSGGVVQWDLASGGNGHYYEVVCVALGIGWQEAMNECEQRGGYLATITSAEENAFVYNLALQESGAWSLDQTNNTEGPWLGGIKENGSWKWNTDEVFGYTHWGCGQPTGNGIYMNYYGLGSNKTDRWNDFPDNVTGYVFESCVPEPMSIALFVCGSFFVLNRRS